MQRRTFRIPMGLNTYCLRALRWNDAQLLDYCAHLNSTLFSFRIRSTQRHWTPPTGARSANRRSGWDCIWKPAGAAFSPRPPMPSAPPSTTSSTTSKRAKAMGSPIVRCIIASDRAALPPGPIEQHIETMVKLLKAVRSQVMDAGLKIAIEIHKDLQAWEHRMLIEAAGKDFVGTYLDTGNPVFVMEDPLTTIEELGRYALTVHLRDSVVYETPRGIAVQWVPLGEGTVDFKQVMAKVREHCPPVYVYIKPITGRPPQVLPIYDREFWKMYPEGARRRISRASWRSRRKASPTAATWSWRISPAAPLPPHVRRGHQIPAARAHGAQHRLRQKVIGPWRTMETMKPALLVTIACAALSLSAATPSQPDFSKTEAFIPMRDGVKLYTVIYAPKNAPERLPFLITRTPYGVRDPAGF